MKSKRAKMAQPLIPLKIDRGYPERPSLWGNIVNLLSAKLAIDVFAVGSAILNPQHYPVAKIALTRLNRVVHLRQ